MFSFAMGFIAGIAAVTLYSMFSLSPEEKEELNKLYAKRTVK